MKKIIVLFLITLLLGCAEIPKASKVKPISKIPEYISLKGLDFTPFTEKGFLFTPEKYLGDYESMGLIEFTYRVEANMKQYQLNEVNEQMRSLGFEEIYEYIWEYNEVDLDAMLQKAYFIAKEMGGDAICNFRIISDDSSYLNAVGYPPVTVPGRKITGFVIKRK